MPGISILDQISLAGFRDQPNEDRLGAAGRHAWVIDGATGLGEPFMGGASDAAWLAQTASEAFVQESGHVQPADLVRAAAARIAGCFETERLRPPREAWELPCGAFLLASVSERGLVFTWSGDCRAVVRVDGAMVLAFGATPLSEEAEAGLVRKLATASGDPAKRYREPAALAALRRDRGVVLEAGAARILSPDPSFTDHLMQAEAQGSRFEVLLMTDGFAAAELRYSLFEGPTAILSAALGSGLEGIGASLRRFERETDPDGQLKPRWKRCDDATALLLKISL
jgi:hypothetical protein